MARPSPLDYPRRRLSHSSRISLFVPSTLALFTTLIVLLYIFTTSSLFIHQPFRLQRLPKFPALSDRFISLPSLNSTAELAVEEEIVGQRTINAQFDTKGSDETMDEVYHDRHFFLEDYKEMNKSLKIYIYPHSVNDPFANVLLPMDIEPSGNYASESYFKKVLANSHFITQDPSRADLFFMPFSIAKMRNDPRISVGGIPDFVRDYIFDIMHKYPYWNRSGGADHFYVACHSIGRSAMDNAPEVKFNAIQVVCSSSYYLSGYIAHKDASLPQIWPRQGDPPDIDSSKRMKLAFFAGEINSPVRNYLHEVWGNDNDISVHRGRIDTPYADALLGSKFCLHVKGFEVNTARIADSLYYGCVPVVIANHYDLPFTDVLNWNNFAVVVATLDIPLLKEILNGVNHERFSMFQRNVVEVRKHFQWHLDAVDYDAFYMVMYELWLRRSSVRVSSGLSVDSS